MKPKTELFLYHLLWSAEQLLRPTYRNLTDSFESWAYRNGLLRQIGRLEKQLLIERKASTAPGARIYRLTERGRLRALGGRDPVSHWSQHWDGRWRLVLFDVPMARAVERQKLRRYLRSRGFGCLQGSVWITPRRLDEEVQLLRSVRVEVESLLFLDANTCAGETAAEIVSAAWDFEGINREYRRYLEILAARPKAKKGGGLPAKILRSWAESEWIAWRDALNLDPLLPRSLLPRDYLGFKAWKLRAKAFQEIKAALPNVSW